MSHVLTTTRRARGLVATTAGALVAAGLVFSAPAAQADPVPAPSLTWKISAYAANKTAGGQLNTHTTADGATETTDGTITFPDGVGSYNAANGTMSITYAGSVTVGRTYSASQRYAVTLAQPRVVVDAEGEGFISAVVSGNDGALNADTGAYANQTTPSRVVVTTFDFGTLADKTGRQSVEATPDWTGVLPANSERATGLGIAADRPVDGASFAPTFLDQLTAQTRAFFYQTSAGQTTKAPAPFTATADPIGVTAEVTSQTSDGVEVDVAGTGFSAQTKVGDTGVYAGIAPSGGLPDVSSMDAMDAFAAADWVTADRISGGAFTSSLTAPVDKLDPSETYSVYTWQAHGHSTPTQDTETPIEIDFDNLRGEPTAKVTGPYSVQPFGSRITYTATIDDATGSVTATVGDAEVTADLVDGVATLELPRDIEPGKYQPSFTYSGDDSFLGTTVAKNLTITKAGVGISPQTTVKPTSKKAGKVTVKVASAVKGGPVPGGKVALRLVKGSTVKTVPQVKLVDGAAAFTLPLLTKGTWTLTALYGGNTRYTATNRAVPLSVG